MTTLNIYSKEQIDALIQGGGTTVHTYNTFGDLAADIIAHRGVILNIGDENSVNRGMQFVSSQRVSSTSVYLRFLGISPENPYLYIQTGTITITTSDTNNTATIDKMQLTFNQSTVTCVNNTATIEITELAYLY